MIAALFKTELLSMGDDTSIVDLKAVSKPISTLVKKIAGAVGHLYLPTHIVRMAKAEAAAHLIRVDSEIECSDRRRRAMHRFLSEEERRQDNMESITAQAALLLEDKSNPDDISDDWLVQFFDKCRLISDSNMQALWAKVLAGEANSPGSFTKRGVIALASMDQHDAEMFRKLCAFVWHDGDDNPLPLVYPDDRNTNLFRDSGLVFSSLTHLDDIGLISFAHHGGYTYRADAAPATFRYFDQSVVVDSRNLSSDGRIDAGNVIFTTVGQQLSNVCDAQANADYFDYVLGLWAGYEYHIWSEVAPHSR